MKLKQFLMTLTAGFLIVSCLVINIDALEIDGTMNESQWKNAESFALISSENGANCGVNYATLSLLEDVQSDRLHLGFKVRLTESAQDSSLYGAAVRVNSGDFIYLTSSGVSAYDRDILSVESAVYAYSDSAFCVEVTLGFKYGIDTLEKLDVRVVDAQGSPSNVLNVALDSYVLTKAAETESVVTLPPTTAAEITESTEKPERTTSVKTTKPCTTKEKTTKKTSQTTTRKYVDDANVDIVAEYTSFVQQTEVLYSADLYTDETESVTVLNANQMKLQKGLSYAAVTAIILLSLGICVAVNLARDKQDKSSDRKV